VDFLRNEMAAPIAYDGRKRGFYYTSETYSLPAISLTAADLFAVFIAEKALAAYENTPVYKRLSSVFDRLKKLLPDNATVWRHTDWLAPRFSILHTPSTRIDENVWDNITRGLRLCRTLMLEYKRPVDLRATRRKVDPYHAAEYQSEWYLIGRCHKRECILTFAVSRIEKALVLDEERFEYPSDFNFERFTGARFGIFWGEKNFKAKVWFSPHIAPYIKEREWHPSQEIIENGDGSIVIKFTANHLLDVTRWILSWGAGARALAPKALVEEVKRELSEAVGKYS